MIRKVTLFLSLIGCFVWDRFCHFLFARDIFETIKEEALKTRLEHFMPILKTCGMIVGVIFVLGTGNLMMLAGAWYFYKQYQKSQAATAAGAAGGGAGGGAAKA
jgi:hypothetical protein